MADMIERRKNLLNAVDALFKAREEWAESDISYFTKGMRLAVEDMLATFADGDIPGDCREISKRVELFNDAWQEYAAKAQLSADDSLLPGERFWRCLDNIRSSRKTVDKPSRQKLESIKELTEQKVTDYQICQIYEWLLPDGAPDFNKLREERETPGTHTGAGFVSPQDRAAQREIEAEAARLKRIQERIEAKSAIAKPAKEPLLDLIKQGLSADQISKMKRVPVGEVYAAADLAGVERPPLHYDLNTRGKYDKPLTEGEELAIDAERKRPTRNRRNKPLPEAFDEEETAATEPPEIRYADEDEPPAFPPPNNQLSDEQRILALHIAGIDPADIARQLSTPEVKIHGNRVVAIIKRFEKDPSAFAIEQ